MEILRIDRIGLSGYSARHRTAGFATRSARGKGR